ncbi:YcfA family protein [Thiocapsa sp. KS1]|nr:type II toxin-antitoxin system HicA family toxin [Thiocapsa sp. KS1]CRI62869.1 YcfA family protein [Thiocapsa sp. KS1]
MSGHHPPLTCAEVRLALKVLGFKARPGRGSHEHWIKETPDGRRKVTVDCPKAPFSQTLIDSMRRQAGVTKDEFYQACGR